MMTSRGLIAVLAALLANNILAEEDANKHMLSEEELLEVVHNQFQSHRDRQSYRAPLRVRRQSGQANGELNIPAPFSVRFNQ